MRNVGVLLATGRPVRAPTSSSISRSAAKAIMSRRRSASEVFSTASAGSSSLRSSVVPRLQVEPHNPTLTRRSPVTAARPLSRYGAIEQRARSRPGSDQLHHHRGHAPLLLIELLDTRAMLTHMRTLLRTEQISRRRPWIVGGCEKQGISVRRQRACARRSRPRRATVSAGDHPTNDRG